MQSFDTSVPALVLKVGEYALHHGGLAVARTLGRLGIPVYGVHEDRFSPAGLSRYATGRFVWRTGDQRHYRRQLLDGMGMVAERIGRPAVLIPTDDHAALFAAEHAEVLRDRFLIPAQAASLVRGVIDKAELHARCRALGFAVPEATTVTGADGLASFARTAAFPVVAKRAVPLLLPDGRRARSTRIVRGLGELLRLDVSSALLLQEHIPAEHGEDWLFHGYCDARSECPVAFTGRKLRSFPPGAGETALGRSERNPALEHQARSLLRELGYRGPVSMDYRFDRRDGRYKLLDLNPRVGAIFRLFATDSGLDVVRALHLDLTGRPVVAGEPVDGRVVMVESNDVRSAWSLLRARRLTPHEWWSSWRAIHETAWFAPDDLVPPLVALARAVAPRRRRAGSAPPRYLPGRA
ncbi:carboxylate--amine ligase [Planomonospora venezuelensis]|uniref:Putative ATP-grasp superfamily ATP-dependent carboligase n=1 Tax=Planomonospora venezuelensis TaxID=1999 RepID=A0A841DFJ0_PLAVE|nr:carboxylate--amine ligase [Planomonospora venezuelensis]MBB5967068.1 putative ATP-grasp superfamily ATP-dependent carboligase [Planomonospora venezuelensis]GIN04908.1 ATP-grasp domain-containing protein [Planomonospora venezuelensis]